MKKRYICSMLLNLGVNMNNYWVKTGKNQKFLKEAKPLSTGLGTTEIALRVFFGLM